MQRLLLFLFLLAPIFLSANTNNRRGILSGLFNRKPPPRYQGNHQNPPQQDLIPRAIPFYDEEDMLRSAIQPQYIGRGNAEWTQRDEEEFSRWITSIGESGCTTASQCLNSPSNYLKGPNENLNIEARFQYMDCGRFPYLLRGYFALKKGLPFSSAKSVEPISGEANDLRYTPEGNKVTSRNWMLPGKNDSYNTLFSSVDPASTIVHRVPADHENTDMYPVRVDKSSIKPGTIYYDPSGHAGMVYKVDDNGVIHTLNANPESTIGRSRFNSNSFKWGANSKHGGGFKRFRPIVSDGGYYRLASNHEISDYSLEQYQYPPTTYYDFIAERMDTNLTPTQELDDTLKELCGRVNAKTKSIASAFDSGLTQQSIDKLPENIYGAEGSWEVYSSPGSDLRLNGTLADATSKVYKAIKENPSLKHELAAIFSKHENSNACKFTYKNSLGQPVNLSLRDIFSRSYQFSFDPYHCPELRMGAPLGSPEMQSCNSDGTKIRWYKAQSTLRNRTERDETLFTGFSLEQLEQNASKLGPTQRPNTNLPALLF
jgi:hypothetical protein